MRGSTVELKGLYGKSLVSTVLGYGGGLVPKFSGGIIML